MAARAALRGDRRLSLNRVDPRFVLRKPVERAVVLGEVDGWRSGLAEAGVEILADTAASRADLSS